MALPAFLERGATTSPEIIYLADIDAAEIARRTDGKVSYSSKDNPPLPIEITWEKFGFTLTGLRDMMQASSQNDEFGHLSSERKNGLGVKGILSGVSIPLLGSVVVMETGSVSFVRPPQQDSQGNETISWITVTKGKGTQFFSTSVGETFNRYPDIFKATQFMQQQPEILLPTL